MGRGAPDPRPLRTLVVSPFGTSSRAGGAEKWLLSLLQATSRLDVHVVVLQDGPLVRELEALGVPVRVQPTGRRPVDVLLAGVRLSSVVRELRPDVVVGNGVKAQLAAVTAQLLAGCRTVWVKHDHSFDRLAPVIGRLSDAVVATVEEVGEPVGRADVTVIEPPAAERSPAGRDEARRHLGGLGLVLDDRPTLVMAGRLVPYKGVDDAVRALARDEARDWRLVVLGDDDQSAPGETERLRALAADLHVTERVLLAPPVDGLSHWLAAFDALAVLTKPGGPRTPGREGFGMTAFEAMSAGVPVVAVGGGAVARRLGGRAGLVVPAQDPVAVAAALGQLSSAERRAEAGRAGRELVAGHPGAVQAAERLAAVLASAANRPGAGRADGPPLSVVLPVYEEGSAVEPVLQRLMTQLAADDEVVVVDDGSSDDTADRAERLASSSNGQVRVVREAANRGAGSARNAGVAAARHAHLAFTDAGCVPADGWLEAIRRGFAERPAPELVCGVYEVSTDGVFEQAVAAACYPRIDEARAPDLLVRVYSRLLGRAFDATRPAGRSMAVSRAAFDRVGGFRDGREAAEDIDFALAVAATGGRCVLALDASVTWQQRPGPVSTARMYHRYGWGDGVGGDRTMIGRDLVRAGVYAAAPIALRVGGRGLRGAVVVGALGYLSLPLRRAARAEQPVPVVLAVPFATALKDVAKGIGCLAGMRAARRDGVRTGAVAARAARR